MSPPKLPPTPYIGFPSRGIAPKSPRRPSPELRARIVGIFLRLFVTKQKSELDDDAGVYHFSRPCKLPRQYSSTELVNWGSNRWALKPEVGYSERWGHWLLDGYAGVWFYTTNSAFYDGPVSKPQNESPIGALEGHLSYDARPRFWVSLDANFWTGGITSLSGIRNLATKQTGSRIGGTAPIPITKHQSIKFSYSNGTYIIFGGNYQNVSVAWQYSWVGRPNSVASPAILPTSLNS
jgi:hypothetical protein